MTIQLDHAIVPSRDRRVAAELLAEEHLDNMYELSPPGSVHALGLSKLRGPDITFWTVWDESVLIGCGALKGLVMP